MAADPIESTVQALADSNELLVAHAALIFRVRASQKLHRQRLHSLKSPPTEILTLSLISSPPSSPTRDAALPPPPEPQPTIKPDLPPAKRARVAKITFQRGKLFAMIIRRDMLIVANGPRTGF